MSDRRSDRSRAEVSLSRQQRRAAERKRRRRGALGNRRAARALASGAALGVGATLGLAPPVEAATFNVANLNDSGAGSLRQAILDANGAAGPDVVTFQAGLTGTITLTSGQLYISDSIDIQGPGAALLTVSGNDASRVFYLYNSAATIDATISGLTITDGDAAAEIAPFGGGVASAGANLVLQQVVVTGNAALAGAGVYFQGYSNDLTVGQSVVSVNTGLLGGGIAFYGDGALAVEDSVVTGNQAMLGGGLLAAGPYAGVTVERSTVAGNLGLLGGGVQMGFIYGYGGDTLVLRDSTVSGNTAMIGGGLSLWYGAAATVENSTVSGNQAVEGQGGGYGGGIFGLYAGALSLRHATISGNSATASGGGVYLYGGGAAIDDSIVADNTAPANNDLGNGEGGSFDLTDSLIEDPGTADINDLGGNVLNQDPQLGALQNNGGPTQTQKPAGTSPAVNAGNSAFTVDQRGLPRPIGAAVDMGAVEINPGVIQLTTSAVSVNENVVTVTITATRTGGTDGAVSASYATADGTATSPADYGSAAATFAWADQDGADQSFQVTIVNDALDEPDEAFTVTLTNPQGGAVLGAITTETVTILDDDEAVSVLEIPTLGGAGKAILAALCGLAALSVLRRKKKLLAPVLLLSLLGAEAAAAPPAAPGPSAARLARKAAGSARAAGWAREAMAAAPRLQAEREAVTLTKVERAPGKVTLILSDGTVLDLAAQPVRIKDHRGGRRAKADVAALAAGQAAVVKIVRRGAGEVAGVKVVLCDDLAAAQAKLARVKAKKPS